MSMTDTHAARELELYTENDGDLHRQTGQSILRNLATKKARGQYKHDLAVKAFGYLVEAGAKKYAKEFGSPGQPWHKMFDVPTRREVAERFTKDFETEYDLGNYDRLLPKKYQKPEKPTRAHAKKAKWNVPEGLSVRWAPVNNAWFALWPASAPISRQQVLKIASTEEMHDWLRDRYGDAYGLASRARAHSTIHYAHRKSPAQLDREIAHVLGPYRGGR